MSFLKFINNKKVIDKYKIKQVIELSGGLINKTYKIETDNGLYVVKVLNKYCPASD